MVDILESKVVGTNKETWYKLIGTKDDTKPTGEFPAGTGHTVAKDSTYFEIGTEIRYEFDGSVWNPKGQVPVTLIEKEITQNGVYSASDDNADGYSSVIVDIPVKEITFSNQPTTFSLSANIENELDVVIPNGITTIAERAFYSCSALKSVVIPNTVTRINQYSFIKCTAIKSLDIPDSVERIENDCFRECTSLKTVTIGNGITNIGAQCFLNDAALETITINKAEGSVSGAPWGAKNATVVWTG